MELCRKNNFVYADFNSRQKEELKKHRDSSKTFVSRNAGAMLTDVIFTNYLGLTDRLSRKRGLITTVDGVHLNRFGAELMAELIRSRLDELQ
jgi:lysophospholipase L1-like esterase